MLVVTARTDVRVGVCAALAEHGCAVVAVDPGIDVDALTRRFRPAVVVADLVRRRAPPPAPVVWLPTAVSTAGDIATAWRRGALDVVPDPSDVVDVVRRVHATIATTEPALGFADLAIDEAGHVVRRAGVELDLTATEFRLLVALATNAGIVVSKPQLLRSVWGFDDYHVNLVEVHVSALRRKLEQHGERLIHTVRGVGYVLRAPTTRPMTAVDVRPAS